MVGPFLFVPDGWEEGPSSDVYATEYLEHIPTAIAVGDLTEGVGTPYGDRSAADCLSMFEDGDAAAVASDGESMAK